MKNKKNVKKLNLRNCNSIIFCCWNFLNSLQKKGKFIKNKNKQNEMQSREKNC